VPDDIEKPATIDLPGQVYEAIRAGLADGRHPPDAVFTETELAAQFGVSRTPVREALAMLARDGLLMQSGRSFRAPRYDLSEMRSLFDVRERLEPYAVRKAVERASADEIAAFVAMASAELAGELDAATYMRAHRRVRSALFALARNRRIVDAIETFEHQTAYVRQKTLLDAGNRRRSIALTHALVAAIASRDAAAAEAAMERTLGAAWEAIAHALETQDKALA
jgi:DNA-binding GntR family transcriptional regulator